MSCSGYLTNKHGYGYCNHGFVAMSGCKIKDEITEKFTPPCCREESPLYVLPEGFDIVKYRNRMNNIEENRGIIMDKKDDVCLWEKDEVYGYACGCDSSWIFKEIKEVCPKCGNFVKTKDVIKSTTMRKTELKNK